MTTALGPVAAWRAARRHCDAACFGYHATWGIARGAGIKASPLWHHGFYQAELERAGLLTGTGRLRVLVAGTADHTLPSILAGLIARDRLELDVIDRCPTPLVLTTQWARTHGPVHVHTETATIPQPVTRRGHYDLAVTDGLLSLLADTATRQAAVAWLAANVRDDGLVLYTTRLAAPGRTLEYDRTGRCLQTAAALGWPQQHPARRHLAAALWHRPARRAPYTHPDDLHQDLATHFDQVEIRTEPAPPSVALRLHPDRRRHHASVIVRAVATHPRTTL